MRSVVIRFGFFHPFFHTAQKSQRCPKHVYNFFKIQKFKMFVNFESVEEFEKLVINLENVHEFKRNHDFEKLR